MILIFVLCFDEISLLIFNLVIDIFLKYPMNIFYNYEFQISC